MVRFARTNEELASRRKCQTKSSSVTGFFLDLCDACLYKNTLTTVKTVVPTTNINNKKNCYTQVKSGFGRFLFLTHHQAGIRA